MALSCRALDAERNGRKRHASRHLCSALGEFEPGIGNRQHLAFVVAGHALGELGALSRTLKKFGHCNQPHHDNILPRCGISGNKNSRDCVGYLTQVVADVKVRLERIYKSDIECVI